MNLPTKFGLGTLTLGTVTAISSAVGIYFISGEETIKGGKPISQLISDQYDYILLDTESDDTKWGEILTKYKTENKIKERWKNLNIRIERKM